MIDLALAIVLFDQVTLRRERGAMRETQLIQQLESDVRRLREKLGQRDQDICNLHKQLVDAQNTMDQYAVCIDGMEVVIAQGRKRLELADEVCIAFREWFAMLSCDSQTQMRLGALGRALEALTKWERGT